jgi:immune inhibitor A
VGFSDAKGWYPGIEQRIVDGKQKYFARDDDASVVIPSRGCAKYTTRVTNADGTPAPGYYGTVLGNGAIVLGTGNPGDANVAYGVTITIKRAATDNSYATVYVTPAKP